MKREHFVVGVKDLRRLFGDGHLIDLMILFECKQIEASNTLKKMLLDKGYDISTLDCNKLLKEISS